MTIKSNIQSWLTRVSLLICVAVMLDACKSDPQSPGFTYMDDMYQSPSFETYAEVNTLKDESNYELFENNMEARTPVKGTIPRGFQPYPYPNTTEGYEQAGLELRNPILFSEEVLEEGKVLYTKFCVHCHGAKGDGDGSVVEIGGFPPPGAYSGPLKDLPVGKMFHTTQYGKGMMGSHASQLTAGERWKIIHYIQKLQYPNGRPGPEPVKTADMGNDENINQEG